MDTIKIQTDHITLGQFLKFADLVPSGGMVKWALEEYDILVNDIPENRRGKKLVPGDRVVIKGVGSFRIGTQ